VIVTHNARFDQRMLSCTSSTITVAMIFLRAGVPWMHVHGLRRLTSCAKLTMDQMTA